GLTFDKPEKVPFRLTQNMVDAFGVTGYEGPFRRTCEFSTRVLRANEATLMTVLESFLNVPAVSMVIETRRIVKVPETPKQVLEVIRNKLQGRFTDGALPLSVEGQVTELIRMAVSIFRPEFSARQLMVSGFARKFVCNVHRMDEFLLVVLYLSHWIR